MHCVGIHITGKVQGVFFRDEARRRAEELSLYGMARNEPDGSVYIEVEGEEEQIKKFVDWCHEGPEQAEVDKVIVKRQPLRDHDGFRIEWRT